MRKYGLILIAVLISSTGVCFAQAECNVLDKNNPALYISYEKVQDSIPQGKKKLEKQVVLRLNNNTNCSIVVPLFDEPVNHELKNGSVVSLDYKIFYFYEDPGTFLTPPGAGGDVRWTAVLRGGESVMFVTPLKHFKPSSELRLSFNYPWDVGSGQRSPKHKLKFGNIRHDLLFSTSFLPDEVFRKKK